MSKNWSTIKGFYGLQASKHNDGKSRSYRQVYREDKKQIYDWFGFMSESEAKELAITLYNNRKNNVKPLNYKELQEQEKVIIQAEAIKEEKELKQMLKEKAFNDVNTISTYFYTVYWEKASHGRKETTNKNMKSSIEKWIIKHLGQIPLAELSKEHIEIMLNAMKKANNKPRNIQYIFNMLKHIYSDAQTHFESSMTNLPAFAGNKIKLEAVNNEKICFLTMQEAHNLLELLYNWKEYCQHNKIKIKHYPTIKDAYGFTLISLLTGLRFGSIANLKWQDVNNGLAYIRTTKNKKSLTVNVSNELIQNMLNERQKLSNEAYIFTNSKNEKYKQPPRIFYKAIQILKFNEEPHRINNDYEKIDFHALRHTYASWLAMRSVNSFELKALMGHSTLKMTERYARLDPLAVQKNTISLANDFAQLRLENGQNEKI